MKVSNNFNKLLKRMILSGVYKIIYYLKISAVVRAAL